MRGISGRGGRAEVAAAQEGLAAVEPEPAADLGSRAVALEAVLGEDRLDFGFKQAKLVGGEGLGDVVGLIAARGQREQRARIRFQPRRYDTCSASPGLPSIPPTIVRRANPTLNPSSTRIERAVKDTRGEKRRTLRAATVRITA